VVTGASSGIGRAVAVRFANNGCELCLNARSEDRLQQLVETFPIGDHLVCGGDYSDSATLAAMAQKIREHWGHVDVLVNCAGVFQGADAVDSDLNEWRKPFDTMFGGGVGITRMAVPLMSNGGRI